MPASSVSRRQAVLPPIDDPSVHVQIDKLARRYDDAGGLIMEMLERGGPLPRSGAKTGTPAR